MYGPSKHLLFVSVINGTEITTTSPNVLQGGHIPNPAEHDEMFLAWLFLALKLD